MAALTKKNLTKVTIVVASLLWGTSAGVAYVLSGQAKFDARRKTPHSHTEQLANSTSLETLRREVENSTAGSAQQAIARVRYAGALAKHGMEARDMPALGAAVEQYTTVLNQYPENPAALIGLASLSFETGVFEKAEELYQRYLRVRPDDRRAQNDYSLVLIQRDRPQEAIPILEAIVRDEPSLFPPRLSLALAYRVSGRVDDASKTANAALKYAPDDTARAIVSRFLSQPAAQGANSATQTATISPATAVDDFFRRHPIVGPKVVSISWKDATTAVVEVREFPVDVMPEIAKVRLEASVKQLLHGLPGQITIDLVSAESGRVLLSYQRE